MDANNALTVNNAATFTFATPTVTNFGAFVSGAISFTWPFASTSSGYSSKLALNINGGYASCWGNINNLTFSDTTFGQYQLLWVNTNLNKFVFKIPN